MVFVIHSFIVGVCFVAGLLAMTALSDLFTSISTASPMDTSEKDLTSTRRLYAIAALTLGAGVILGAFGAHALKDRLPSDLFLIFEKAIQYWMYMTLGLFGVASLSSSQLLPIRSASRVFFSILLGTSIFSGSLILLALSGQRWLGAITPIGGVILIASWFFLGVRLLKQTP